MTHFLKMLFLITIIKNISINNAFHKAIGETIDITHSF